MNREAILAALATRVSALRAPWPEFFDEYAAPYTLLTEDVERVDSESYEFEVISMQVWLRRAVGYDGDDEARSTAANNALAQLISEAEGTDHTLGGSCLDLRYTEGNTEYPTDGKSVGAWAAFTVQYQRG